MIYVDTITEWPVSFIEKCAARDPRHTAQTLRVSRRHGNQWCHLWCDPGEEEGLHDFARKIGMRPAWFQNKPGFPHYDLVPSRREVAVKLGAVETDLSDWLRKQKQFNQCRNVS